MVWATVSSQSCFCWLYRASPSLAAKNDFSIDHLMMSKIHLLYCWKRVFAMCSAFSWQNLLAFVLLHFILQGQTCLLLLQVSLDFLLLHSSPLWYEGHLFCLLVLKGLVGFPRTVQLHLLWDYCLGYRLGFLWYWIANAYFLNKMYYCNLPRFIRFYLFQQHKIYT